MNFKIKFDEKTKEKLLYSIYNIEHLMPIEQSEYYAKFEFISYVSRMSVFVENDEYEKRGKFVFAITNPIKIQSDEEIFDYYDYIRLSLAGDNLPYLYKPGRYNLLLASNRSWLQKGIIFWIEDGAQAVFIVFRNEFLCILVDSYFKPVAVVEFNIPDSERVQKEQYVKSGELIKLGKDEALAALAGAICMSSNALFKLIYGLKNIDYTYLLAYGLHNKIITTKFIFDFIVYLKSINSPWLDVPIFKQLFELQDLDARYIEKLLRDNVPYKEFDLGKPVETIYEVIWIFLKLLDDLHREKYIDLTEYSNLLCSPTRKVDFCSLIDEKSFDLITSFKGIDVWELVYFGIRNYFNNKNNFCINFAVYLMLGGDESPFVIELAGINKYEIKKAEGLMEKEMVNFDKLIHDKEFVLNKLWHAVELVQLLVEKKIL